jgi:hypothetical protein
VGTLTPPFSTSTLFNTVVYSPLNPTRNPETRFIDQNIVAYGTSTNLATKIGSGNLTISGGDIDTNTSLHAQYVMLRGQGGPNYIFQTAIVNGAMHNATNGGENPSLSVFADAFSFSRVAENVYYYISSGVIQQAVINAGTPMAATVTSNAHFPFTVAGNCPGAPASGTPTWTSSLTVSQGDGVFMFGMSWVGGQGYGHLVFAYSPTLGCSALDLAPNGTSSTYGNWYSWCTSNCSAATPAGTESTCYDPYYASGDGIHDVFSSVDGTMENIMGGCWNGNTSENPAYWQINSGNVLTSSDLNPPAGQLTGGHAAIAYTHEAFTNAPTPNNRVISPLSNANIANFTPLVTLPGGTSGPGGWHIAFPWDLNTNDLNYVLFETACSPSYCANYLTPNYLQNEVFAISPSNASAGVVRLATTYNSGTSSYFACGNGIGFASQDGKWWFWIADGLNNLGTDGNSNPLCSVFVVHLDGGSTVAPVTVGPCPRCFAWDVRIGERGEESRL